MRRVGISLPNDNSTAFQDFMVGYWHQMSPELYSSLREALVDFRETEGEQRFADLLRDLSKFAAKDRFPSISDIQEAYDDGFWSDFDRILTKEELESCDRLFPDLEIPAS